MVTSRFYLDCRYSAPGSAAPLKIVLTHKGVRALILLGISLLPSQWDAHRQLVVNHPMKQELNSQLMERKLNVDTALYRLASAGELRGLRASAIKNKVLAELFPDEHGPAPLTFISRFDEFVAVHSPGTRRVYAATRARMRAFLGSDAALASLTFDMMDVAWLRRFEAFLAKTSPSRNARNIHFRNIRAVFNDTITEGLTTCYPFRKFKITPEPTRKRALTVEQLRMLFNAQVEPHEQRYLDCFKLIFMLCGINIVDLCNLGSLVNGRAEYSRAKTHRLYSIKVEPEAAELINRYRGKGEFLLSYLDTCSGYRMFYTRLSFNLRNISSRLGLPQLSTYWARHSWATVAAALDVPKETVAAALGHGGNTVTDIYIDFDQKKVDMANRKVLDWVLYGKG